MAGRPEMYPWGIWFKEAAGDQGKQLIAGIHFPEHISLEGFRNSAWVQAKKRGWRLSINIRADVSPPRLLVRAFPVADMSEFFTGRQGVKRVDELTMPSYEFVRLLKLEGARRGLRVQATTDELGNVNYQCDAPAGVE